MTGIPVHLWWTGVDDTVDGNESLLAVLDTDETDRYQAYRVAPPRRRYLTGRALLRIALGQHLGMAPARVPLRSTCDGCGGTHGRPRLIGPVVGGGPVPEISVSHSGNRVLVALALGAAVGVDVQEVDDRLNVAALIASTMAPAEAAALNRIGVAERPKAFARMWTRKEAVLKALGVGLALPLPLLRVTAPDQPPEVLHWPNIDVPPQLTLRELDAGAGYQATLAVLADAVDVDTHDGTALLAGY